MRSGQGYRWVGWLNQLDIRARIAGSVLLCGLAVLLLLASTAPSVAADQTTGSHRLLSVSGRMQIHGQPAQVDVLVDVAPGQDPDLVGQNALSAMGAKPLRQPAVPSPDFALSGLTWPQFFDRGPNDDFVLQFYNPAGDPTGGFAGDLAQRALTNAEVTWSSVRTSGANYRFGGVTNRCPTFYPTCGAILDGSSVVGWLDFGPFSPVLGVTTTTFRVSSGTILQADIALNSRFGWFTDPSSAPPFSFDIESVVLHENGHALGLGHSTDPTAVMFPFLAPLQVRRTLGQDDIDAISFLYPLHPRPTQAPPRPSPITGPLTTIARLGDAAPGFRNFYDFDFEPYQLADDDTAAYAADLISPIGAGEGTFLFGLRGGTLMAKTGEAAPGGGTFGGGVLTNVGLNNAGDAAFAFLLSPFRFPEGLNSGVYRYSTHDASLTAIVVPFVTPAPGGGTFQGAFDHAAINNLGDVVFAGIIPTTQGISDGLGTGVFRAGRDGTIRSVLSPGDAAPSGGTFDFADAPWINARGDVVLGAHVHGEECINGQRQSVVIYCGESLYLKRAGSSSLQSIAHAGDGAPGGGVFRYALDPVINGRGDVVFIGDITPAPGSRRLRGVFLYSAGTLTRIAGPGDAMPGGGEFVAPAFQPGNWSINDAGTVAFSALLDTDTLGIGIRDTGLYVWSRGALNMVARTGTDLPGLGTILALAPPDFVGGRPFSGAALNNREKILFDATVLGPPPTYQPVIGVLVEASTGVSN